jgi:hypothetical protein
MRTEGGREGGREGADQGQAGVDSLDPLSVMAHVFMGHLAPIFDDGHQVEANLRGGVAGGEGGRKGGREGGSVSPVGRKGI